MQLPDGLSDDARKVLAAVAKNMPISNMRMQTEFQLGATTICFTIAASLGFRPLIVDSAVRFEKIGEERA